MVIHGVYIVSKSGGLIFNHDNNIPRIETEKVFNYPIDLKLDYDVKRVSVAFGQKDGINGKFLANIASIRLIIDFSMNNQYIFASLSIFFSWACAYLSKWYASEWEHTCRWQNCERYL